MILIEFLVGLLTIVFTVFIFFTIVGCILMLLCKCIPILFIIGILIVIVIIVNIASESVYTGRDIINKFKNRRRK